MENEHCTNVNLFRALRDIPLPYQLEEQTLDEDFADHPSPIQTRESEMDREEEEIRDGEHPTDPTSTVANDVDLEAASIAGKTPTTLRARRDSIRQHGSHGSFT